LREELKVAIAFPVVVDPMANFTMTPWLKDRLDFKILTPGGFNTDNSLYYTAAGDVNIPDATKTVNIQPRNRFYVGLDNTISVPKTIDIGINFEFRMENDMLAGNPQTAANLASDKNKISSPLTSYRLSPNISFKGSYDLGLSFSIVQYFSFYLLPSMTRDNKDATRSTNNEVFATAEFEGFYNIAFDFMHFLGDKNIKGGIFLDDYCDILVFATPYVLKSNTTLVNIGEQASYESVFTAGLSFNIFGIKPMIAYYMRNLAFTSDDPGLQPWMWNGIKAGIGFTKDWFSLDVVYIGRYNTFRQGRNTSDNLTGGPDESKNFVNTATSNGVVYKGTPTAVYATNWENHIEFIAKIKL